MARKAKKVSLARFSWDATPERMLKAANDNEIVVSANDNGAPVTTRRLTDWPIARLHSRRQLDPSPVTNDILREAAERYAGDYHAAGMMPLAAIDYGRVRVDGGRGSGGGDFRRSAQDRHRQSVKALGAFAKVVDAIVLREETVMGAGIAISGSASERTAQRNGIDALRRGLRILAERYHLMTPDVVAA